MKIKKINAAVGLLASLGIFIHVGYIAFAYLTFYNDPSLTILTAMPFMLCACLHAILGMGIVFFSADGTRADLYPKQNAETILQRVSAILILPLIVLHLKTFGLLQSCAESGKTAQFILLLLSQPLFYATAFTHVAVSFSRALITLGRIASPERKKTVDRVVYILCAVLFALATFAVLKAEIAMFLPSGGAA